MEKLKLHICLVEMGDEVTITTARMPTPRHLEDKESVESINHWWSTFRNYYRRDKFVGGFLKSTAKWDPAKPQHGFVDETEGLKRAKADIEDDFMGFMETISSYMKHSYLTERLQDTTHNISEVKNCLFKLYDAELSQDTFLDITKMKKSGTETPLQFFEKLSSHVRRHLTKPEVKVESYNSGADGDKMNLTMMNVITVTWLEKMSPKLVDAVKVEFANDLREKSLYEIMPRIAAVVPQLLQKGDLASAVNMLTVGSDEDETEGASQDVFRMEYKGNNRSKRFGDKNRFDKAQYKKDFGKTGQKPTCMHCQLLNKELKADFNVHHDPAKCYRKKSAIRLLNAMSEEENEDEYEIEGEIVLNNHIQSHSSFQADTHLPADPSSTNLISNLSKSVLRSTNSFSSSEFPTSSFSERLVDISNLPNKIRRVRESARRLAVRKAPSPSVLARYCDQNITVTLDEGAELNVVNERIINKANAKVIPTQNTATAAGSSNLKILGQTEEDFIVNIKANNVSIPLNLGKVLVVRDLGCDCLCGEPGKRDNRIVTIPWNRTILFCFQGETHSVSYLSVSKPKYSVCRVSATRTIFPEDTVKIQVPDKFSTESHVVVSPKRGFDSWYRPGTYNIQKGGVIELENISQLPVNINRSDQIGEMREANEVDYINKIWEDTPEAQQFHNPIPSPEDNKNHLEDIKVDPDKQLEKNVREKFWEICEEYRDVITPRPGRYNAAWGNVDTRIDFTTSPPENSKIYSPNYSPQMKLELAKKLDKLMLWGVLRRPEEIGVTVQYCSPSMIIPKSEPGEYRLVTDFSSLNKHIRKYPGTSPTIQEAKESIARSRYVVLLDLSNYFYQGGLSRNDSRYLGVTHPFLGTLCYTVEPQGLKNSSEHAYERIQRVFGDMIQRQQMTSMADGLYVLAQSQEELLENFEEVMRRVRLAGLTVKPSKLEIAPRSTILFGWQVKDNCWLPTAHTTSALSKAALPKTAKQLRGWLGAFKQFSACVNNYGSLLSGLEKLHAGVQSKDLIKWTEEDIKNFEEAKAATNNVEAITTPCPSDKLHSYSDFSQNAEAVGGRMILKRKIGQEEITRLVGYFSAKLDPAKIRWNPCERESLAVRLVLEHFSPYIRQSLHPVTHHCDNRPTVQAWQRSLKGAYSNSSRMGAFLTGLSALSVELVYTPGKELFTADYASRHPVYCDEIKCQVCKFNKEWSDIGENCAKIRSVKVEDIVSGKVSIPYHQRKTWKEMQDNDRVHVKLRSLIASGGTPEKKKTKGPHTQLKYLHNLFLKQELKMEEDGMIMVKARKNSDSTEEDTWAFSVPQSLYPGLAQAIHLRLAHPSKAQMATVMSRHFYTPGYMNILTDIADHCLQCQSLKLLPKILSESKSSEIKSFASRFSVDIMEREGQRVMVAREELTQMTFTDIAPDQTANSLRESIIKLISPLVSEQGTVVRTDGAPAFTRLAQEAKDPDDVLNRAGIQLDIGRVANKNKNGQAENAIKILEKEIIKYDPAIRQISPTDLVLITKQMNLRPNKSGFSPRELWLNRAWTDNSNLVVDDIKLAQNLTESRLRQNSDKAKFQASKGHKVLEPSQFKVGDLVFLREDKDKHKARSLHTVVEVMAEGNLKIKKTENQFRSRSIEVTQEEVTLVNVPSNKLTIAPEVDKDPNKEQEVVEEDVAEPTRPRRQAAIRSRQKTRDMIRRVIASKAKYAWIYVPHSYDDQYDVMIVPNDPDMNLDMLFQSENESNDEYSMELHEHHDHTRDLTDDDDGMRMNDGNEAMMDVDISNNHDPGLDAVQTDSGQATAPPSPSLQKTSTPIVQTQSRRFAKPGKFSRTRSDSIPVRKPEKRTANSPKQAINPKIPKSSPRRSRRTKFEQDYYAIEHKYDDV